MTGPIGAFYAGRDDRTMESRNALVSGRQDEVFARQKQEWAREDAARKALSSFDRAGVMENAPELAAPIDQNAAQWGHGAIKNLMMARDPQEFASIAQTVAAHPMARWLGITPEQITPENVRALAAQIGLAPEQSQPEQFTMTPGSVRYERGADGQVRQVAAVPTAPREPQAPPSGYRWGAGGTLAPIQGGPADPTGPQAKRNTQPLRKEFRSLPSVRDFETAVPIINSAQKAPDNGYGDLQLIYSVGKLLDPNSVVREGELALTIAAGSPLQRIIGTTRFTTERGGRLTPQTRQQILEMLNERVGAYQQAYDRDYEQYAQYASELGIDPQQIVGQRQTIGQRAGKPSGQPLRRGGGPGRQSYTTPSGAKVEILP